MLNFTLEKYSELEQSLLFSLSTDIENFSNILPKYFKSLEIMQSDKTEFLVNEKVFFMGRTLNIKTKHVVVPPNIHQVYILSGPLRGTEFIEYYEKEDNRTKVSINVKVNFVGIFKIFSILNPLIKRQMDKVMSEFLESCKGLVKYEYSN